MDLYEKNISIAHEKNIPIRKLEENSGIANGSIRHWKTRNPTVQKLRSVASHLDVSIDYLLDNDSHSPNIEIKNYKVRGLARKMNNELSADEIEILSIIINKFSKNNGFTDNSHFDISDFNLEGGF